jgi:hypothetical protein
VKSVRIVSALTALLAGITGTAFAELQILEDAVETTMSSVVLPSEAPSSLVVTPCKGCKPLLVPTSARSQYFINKEPVELAELKRRLQGHPDAGVVIIYDRKTKELRRLRAYLREAAS